MKWYLKILLIPILCLNLLVALLLVCCAYSPMLPPEYMPLLSLAGLAFPFVLAANVLFFVLWLVLYRPFMLVSLIACLVCFPQIRAFSPINITLTSFCLYDFGNSGILTFCAFKFPTIFNGNNLTLNSPSNFPKKFEFLSTGIPFGR